MVSIDRFRCAVFQKKAADVRRTPNNRLHPTGTPLRSVPAGEAYVRAQSIPLPPPYHPPHPTPRLLAIPLPPWNQMPMRMKYRLPAASPEFSPTFQPLIDASWALSCFRRSFSSSTTAFHSGWCNANPSAICRRGITRLCPGVTE